MVDLLDLDYNGVYESSKGKKRKKKNKTGPRGENYPVLEEHKYVLF